MFRPQLLTVARTRGATLARRLPAASGIREKASMAVEHRAHQAPPLTQSPASSRMLLSLLAAAAGVGTVSAVTAVVECTSPVPKSDPNGQRFSQETFGGRFARMLLACDPRLLLYSDDYVHQCASVLANAALYDDPAYNDRALWEAKRVFEAACPDGETIIPRPFRMSGFVPYNGPICVAIVASQSTFPLLFWSWVNQSQNALVNYYNRNASSPMANATLAMSYGAAVGSALIVAFGLATAIQRHYSPQQAKQLLQWVAFPSAVVASSLNCYIVRSPELETGIPLMNVQGENVLEGATSLEAARRGVNATTASRALLQAPVYLLPPLLMSTAIAKQWVMRHPAMVVPMTTYLLLTSFGIGLPATVAIFPVMSQVNAKDVEEGFRNLRDSEGKPYETFYYNKGL